MICIPRLELHCAAGWLGLGHRGIITMHFSQSHGFDGLPPLLLCHAGWIDVADMWALSPRTVSEALYGLDGKKPEALGLPRTIPDMGFEQLL
jgi:hypothetical protein